VRVEGRGSFTEGNEGPSGRALFGENGGRRSAVSLSGAGVEVDWWLGGFVIVLFRIPRPKQQPSETAAKHHTCEEESKNCQSIGGNGNGCFGGCYDACYAERVNRVVNYAENLWAGLVQNKK
jgi:hypothetical protein